MITVAYDEALESVIAYTLENEHEFITEEIERFESFEEWAEYVLHETVYGCANIVAFRNSSDAEMMKDLKQVWERGKI